MQLSTPLSRIARILVTTRHCRSPRHPAVMDDAFCQRVIVMEYHCTGLSTAVLQSSSRPWIMGSAHRYGKLRWTPRSALPWEISEPEKDSVEPGTSSRRTGSSDDCLTAVRVYEITRGTTQRTEEPALIVRVDVRRRVTMK